SDDQPYSYQDTHGGRREVATSYALAAKSAAGRQVYGFRVGEYDRSEPLVIDPVMLVYCGFLGGSGDDRGNSIAVDSAGNAYIAGTTTVDETTFPVLVGPGLTYHGNQDVFVAKVNAAGTGLVYCGYVGAANLEIVSGIALDSAGNAYLTGTTSS